MVLELGANLIERKCVDVVDGDHDVRVADAHEGVLVGERVIVWDVLRTIKTCLRHASGHHLPVDLTFENSGDRADRDVLLVRLLREPARNHARAVATGLALRSIGVPDAHGDVGTMVASHLEDAVATEDRAHRPRLIHIERGA